MRNVFLWFALPIPAAGGFYITLLHLIGPPHQSAAMTPAAEKPAIPDTTSMHYPIAANPLLQQAYQDLACLDGYVNDCLIAVVDH